MFDSVHNMKNVFNNLINKRTLRYFDKGVVKTCDMQHIKELYRLEENKLLNLAPQLTKRCLEPSNLDGLSMKPALSVFNDRTVAALETYSSINAEWLESALFIKKFLSIWKILNVKSPITGKCTRQIFSEPVKHVNDWKLVALEEFLAFIETWRQKKCGGLTAQTFSAWTQTISAMIACVRFLLSQCSLNYVMPGQLQSDPLEERFGWFRQMHGGNYYISVRQVVEGERRIRALSLTKFSHYNPSQMKPPSRDQRTNDHETVREIQSDIESLPIPSPSEADLSAAFYVTGALCKSEVESHKCASCQQLLVDSDNQLPHELPRESSAFFERINRSGLLYPSDFAFNFIVRLWELMTLLDTADRKLRLIIFLFLSYFVYLIE